MWEWHDYWRVVDFLVCASAFAILVVRFKQNHWSWNTKTTDYWFALAVWCFTGAASSVEGILTDAEPGFRIMLILVGGLVTFKALRRKGAWGENTAKNADVL